jgi:hypothetical protein
MTVVDVGGGVHVGVLSISSMNPTLRVGSCCIPKLCDELDIFNFFIFTKTIVNDVIHKLSKKVINQSWHD